MSLSRISYENLLLQEKGQWEMTTGELMELGVCGFCGHISKNGYAIKNKDGRKLNVGTDCVFILCNLPKHQQIAIKHLQALQKNATKHAVLIQTIKRCHEFITKAQYNNWIDENGIQQISDYYLGRDGKQRIQAAKETLLCKKHPCMNVDEYGGGVGTSNCPACIGAAIIYKATKTTKVHPFWIEKYHQLMKVNQ